MGWLSISNYLLIAVFLASFVNAATIHGSVYDISLKKANNAKVEIDTSPKQQNIAQNGSYSFNVPIGFYTIKAFLLNKNTVIASVQENITVNQDGSYVLDLILFPDIEEGVEDINIEIGEEIDENSNTNMIFIVGFIVLFVSGLVAGVIYFKKIRKMENKEDGGKEEKDKHVNDADLEGLVKIIKQEGGRATQKYIRKQIPLSEAKISLMIAELKHKGIVEKIKKGRGNIIILKKK